MGERELKRFDGERAEEVARECLAKEEEPEEDQDAAKAPVLEWRLELGDRRLSVDFDDLFAFDIPTAVEEVLAERREDDAEAENRRLGLGVEVGPKHRVEQRAAK